MSDKDLLEMAENQEAKRVFTDRTPMPFGKYKGTPLGNVPARYLLWLYDESSKDAFPALRKYLEANKRALELEADEEEERIIENQFEIY